MGDMKGDNETQLTKMLITAEDGPEDCGGFLFLIMLENYHNGPFLWKRQS